MTYSATNIGMTLKSGLSVVQGSFVENGTIRKLGYGFLLAFHNNYGWTGGPKHVQGSTVTISSYLFTIDILFT